MTEENKELLDKYKEIAVYINFKFFFKYILLN